MSGQRNCRRTWEAAKLAATQGVPFLSLSSAPCPCPRENSSFELHLQDEDFMEPLRAGFVASISAESWERTDRAERPL